jgi:hypothetical protein
MSLSRCPVKGTKKHGGTLDDGRQQLAQADSLGELVDGARAEGW